MKKNTLLRIIFIFCIYSSNLQAQDYLQFVDTYFNELVQNKKLTSQDIQWRITSEHISAISNVHHIYFSQEINGIEIAQTESSLHLSPENNVISTSNRFVNNSLSKLKSGKTPSLSAIEIVNVISRQMGYDITNPIEIIEESKDINKKTKLSSGGISNQDISLVLNYFQNENEDIVLVWVVNLLENEETHLWDFYIDANSGEILNKIDNYFACVDGNSRIQSEEFNCNSNLYDISNYKLKTNNNALECVDCYEVFPFPFESPYYGEREIVTNPANIKASPYGWHDINGIPGADFLFTSGNNISASHFDTFYSPNGGTFLNFTEYPFDENYSEENNYIDAALTNVFYWGNVMHDIIYQYGFDESAGNFQENNYNQNINFGNDPIAIFSFDDITTCNAGIIMGPDGVQPRIRMGTCGNKDSDFDNHVILHEYAHGITYRLVGGALSRNCFFGVERMGEGYSDWYGLLLTINENDQGINPKGYAPYYLNQGINGAGFRQYPYTTNMDLNPLIYDVIPQNSNKINWIWASVLWEMTWNLIDQFGYDDNLYNFTGDVNQDAGNIIALAIVTESLKVLKCDPSLIDCRNAILTANRSIYGSEYECLLWDAFAKRGLGINAYRGSIASFDVPATTSNLNLQISIVCENSGIITGLNGGTPSGGVYSGNGIVDDGNGSTYSFDSQMAGIGEHTITYELFDSFCTIASTSTKTIEVMVDTTAPEFICPENLSVIIPAEEEEYSLISFSSLINATDNCTTEIDYTQIPIIGTNLGVGDYTINVEVTDQSNNSASCSFILTIEKEVYLGDDFINIYPNPTNGNITINSLIDLDIVSIVLFDINGKLVKKINFNEFGFERSIFLEGISKGIYFFSFISDEKTITKRIIKE